MKRIDQADGKSRRAGGYHQFLKRRKHRDERRRAKQCVECAPGYNRYSGYET